MHSDVFHNSVRKDVRVLKNRRRILHQAGKRNQRADKIKQYMRDKAFLKMQQLKKVLTLETVALRRFEMK